MSRVFINEWKRAINASAVIAVIGVMFCICFNSWNDLVSEMQSGNSVWCVYYFTSNSAFGGIVADTADLFHKWLVVHSPVRYCMIETALGFMRGMIWAGVSLFVSLYVTDRLVITMFPFFGSYAIVRISQMLSIDDKLRLDQILIGRTVIKDSGYTVMIAVIISGVLVFLMGCVFTRKMARGLKDGTFYESK